MEIITESRRLPPAQRSGVRGACRLALLGTLALLACACVYRIPIQQGNFLRASAVEQVKVGMTPSQVRYLLGTPMVPDPFDQSRWDYDYYFKNHRLQTPRRSHVVIYFANGHVTRIQSDLKPAPAAS